MLTETINFIRQVELNRIIEDDYPVSKLTRLGDSLLEKEGFVTAKLNFGKSAGFACLKGSVTATLMVECQRCLQPIATDVVGNFKFALVSSEEEFELLPEEFEPYLVEGEEQSLIDLIEDELLLSLPMVAIHSKSCSVFMAKHEQALKKEKEASHPFAALKSLKGDKANKDKIN